MILEDLVLWSRVNVRSDVSGLDSLEECLNKDYFLKYPHRVEYHFNSRGFRDSEWPDSIEELKNAIWCVGDSFTVGLGSPYEFTWPQVLAAATGRRCINISMDGASNTWISRRAQQIIKEVAPTHMVVLWSYIHRRENPNTEWSDEARRMHSDKRDSEIEDLENFVNCYKQLNTSKISTDIFNGAIPNYIYHHYCEKIWSNLRDPSWPVPCPQRRSEFLDLPEYVQQELFAQDKNKQRFELMFAHTEFLDHHALCRLANLDYARDYHHFDVVTSKFFVEEICKKLFAGN
jgi:hypothetical protein